MTALFIGALAAGASAANGRSHSRAFSGPLWVVLTVIAALAGAGSFVAWVTSRRRWRPGPLIGALIGVAALIGAPLEAMAVRPHVFRAHLLAVDIASGRERWASRPPLIFFQGLSIDAGGTLVADGTAATAACSSSSVRVRLDPATGRARGPKTLAPPGVSYPPTVVSHDGPTTYQLEAGPSGASLSATENGAVRWQVAFGPGPVPLVSFGAGVIVVDNELPGFRGGSGAVAAPALVPGQTGGENGMRVLDAATGQQLWADASAKTVGAAVAGNAVWVLGPDGSLVSYDPRSGAELTRRTLDFAPSMVRTGPALWSVDGTLVTVAASGQLVGIRTNGRVAWRVPLAITNQGGVTVVASRSSVIAGVDGRISGGCNGGE